MAHHASAKKRIRTNVRRRQVNRNRLSRVRTMLRAVERAIEGGDHAEAMKAFAAAQGDLMRGAQRGLMSARRASRRLSRLNVRIRGLA